MHSTKPKASEFWTAFGLKVDHRNVLSGFLRKLNKLAEKASREQGRIVFLQSNWFWHQEQVEHLKKLLEGLLNELDRIEKANKEFHESSKSYKVIKLVGKLDTNENRSRGYESAEALLKEEQDLHTLARQAKKLLDNLPLHPKDQEAGPLEEQQAKKADEVNPVLIQMYRNLKNFVRDYGDPITEPTISVGSYLDVNPSTEEKGEPQDWSTKGPTSQDPKHTEIIPINILEKMKTSHGDVRTLKGLAAYLDFVYQRSGFIYKGVSSLTGISHKKLHVLQPDEMFDFINSTQRGRSKTLYLLKKSTPSEMGCILGMIKRIHEGLHVDLLMPIEDIFELHETVEITEEDIARVKHELSLPSREARLKKIKEIKEKYDKLFLEETKGKEASMTVVGGHLTFIDPEKRRNQIKERLDKEMNKELASLEPGLEDIDRPDSYHGKIIETGKAPLAIRRVLLTYDGNGNLKDARVPRLIHATGEWSYNVAKGFDDEQEAVANYLGEKLTKRGLRNILIEKEGTSPVSGSYYIGESRGALSARADGVVVFWAGMGTPHGHTPGSTVAHDDTTFGHERSEGKSAKFLEVMGYGLGTQGLALSLKDGKVIASQVGFRFIAGRGLVDNYPG